MKWKGTNVKVGPRDGFSPAAWPVADDDLHIRSSDGDHAITRPSFNKTELHLIID